MKNYTLYLYFASPKTKFLWANKKHNTFAYAPKWSFRSIVRTANRNRDTKFYSLLHFILFMTQLCILKIIIFFRILFTSLDLTAVYAYSHQIRYSGTNESSHRNNVLNC